MQKFINDYILKYFGWTIWRLLSLEDERWYFVNWIIKRNSHSVRPENKSGASWDYSEVWIDSMLSPPYVLLLIGVGIGTCSVINPAEGYKVIKSFNTYKEARLWLTEDEYEVIDSRPLSRIDPGGRSNVSIDIPVETIEAVKQITLEVIASIFRSGGQK